jgi:hypothetical protein
MLFADLYCTDVFFVEGTEADFGIQKSELIFIESFWYSIAVPVHWIPDYPNYQEGHGQEGELAIICDNVSFSCPEFRSGIRCLVDSGIRCLFYHWIRDPGWVKYEDPDPDT